MKNDTASETTGETQNALKVAEPTPRWTLHLFGRSAISLPSAVHKGHRVITVIEETPEVRRACNSHKEQLAALKGLLEVGGHIDLFQGLRLDVIFKDAFNAAKQAEANAEAMDQLAVACKQRADELGIPAETLVDQIAMKLMAEHGIPERIVNAAKRDGDNLLRELSKANRPEPTD